MKIFRNKLIIVSIVILISRLLMIGGIKMAKNLFCDNGCKYEGYDKDEMNNLLDDKQETLIFDNTPTTDSLNPVTSDGIKTALDMKLNSSSITSGTENPSGGNDGDIYFQYQ